MQFTERIPARFRLHPCIQCAVNSWKLHLKAIQFLDDEHFDAKIELTCAVAGEIIIGCMTDRRMAFQLYICSLLDLGVVGQTFFNYPCGLPIGVLFSCTCICDSPWLMFTCFCLTLINAHVPCIVESAYPMHIFGHRLLSDNITSTHVRPVARGGFGRTALLEKRSTIFGIQVQIFRSKSPLATVY